MSTEVKPNDWNEGDNRWEPTPGGGGGVPTPSAEDVGKVLTAVEAIGPVTILPATSITFDEYGYAELSTVTISATDIPVGTIGTLTIGSDSYTTGAWSYDSSEGWGVFGIDTADDPILGYDGTVWYVERCPLSATATVSMTANLPTGDAQASWETASGGGEAFAISQGLTNALLACVQTAVSAAVSGNDNLAYGSDSGQQLSSESDTETAFAAAKAFFDGGSVKLSFPGIGVKLSPTTGWWSDSDAGYELVASIGGTIPAYSIPWVGTGFVQWNINVACQLDGDNNPVYGYDIYVAVSINKVAGGN